MTLYGYEQPVSMPSIDVYDTDLMKAYIAGVKEQYDNAQQKLDTFFKDYSDFQSDSYEDMNKYHKETIGGAVDLINNMYANGEDPLKSPEGRRKIGNYIATRPYALLNGLKQNAENRKIYNQARAALESKGLFNKDLEDMILKELGLNPNSSFDEHGNFVAWNRFSPIESKSLFELANPEFQKFSPTEYLGQSYNPDGTPHWGYLLRGVSDANQRKATLGAKNDIDKTVYGKFYRRQAEQQVDALGLNLTPEARQERIEQQFEKNILQSQAEYLQPKEEADAAFLERWRVNNSNLQNALNRENARIIAGIKNPDVPTDHDNSFTARTHTNTNEKRKQQFINKSTYYFTRMSQLFKNGAWKNQDKDGKKAKFFENLSKGGVQRMIQKGFLDKDGYPTELYVTNVSKLIRNLPSEERKQMINEFYADFQSTITSPIERKICMQYVTGTSGQENNNASGEVDKNWTMQLGQGGWQIKDSRMNQIVGIENNKFTKALQDYLKRNNVQSYCDNEGDLTSVATIPKGNGKYNVDFGVTVGIKMSDLKEFFRAYKGIKPDDGGDVSDSDVKEVAKLIEQIGGTRYIKDISTGTKKIKGKDTKIYTSEDYVYIPIVKTLSNNSQEFSALNLDIDKAHYGSEIAYKLSVARRGESANR